MVFVIILCKKNSTLIFNYDIRGIESVGKTQIKNKIEGQSQSSQKFKGSLTMPRCIFYQNLQTLTWIGGELSRGQPKNGVIFNFLVTFDLEGQGCMNWPRFCIRSPCWLRHHARVGSPVAAWWPHERVVAHPTMAPNAKTWSTSILPQSFRL